MVELDDVGLHTDPLEERLHLHGISADVEHDMESVNRMRRGRIKANESIVGLVQSGLQLILRAP